MCVPLSKPPQTGMVQTVAYQRWRLQGTGWTELSCVCLSTLAVQNILSPVQQAQTGSRMTTQPEGQPPVGNRSDTPEHLRQQLQPRVTLDLRQPVSNQAAYCNPPRVKPPPPIKDNKTHCWNFYCASYSTLFLVVLINSLTPILFVRSFAAPLCISSSPGLLRHKSSNSCYWVVVGIKITSIPAGHRNPEQLVLCPLNSIIRHNIRP